MRFLRSRWMTRLSRRSRLRLEIASIVLCAILALVVGGCGRAGDGCFESETSCSNFQFEADNCLRAGCEWGKSCAPRPCYNGIDRLTCEAIQSCRWDGQNCFPSINIWDCAHDASACDADPRCVYVTTCFGDLADCKQFKTPSECGPHPQCEWSNGEPSIRIGSNDSVPTADRLLCEWGGESPTSEPR